MSEQIYAGTAQYNLIYIFQLTMMPTEDISKSGSIAFLAPRVTGSYRITAMS